MDLNSKKKIISAIQTAPDDAKLSEYLLNVSKALNPTRYKAKTITIHESIKELLNETKSPFGLKLSDEKFSGFSEFFFLTAGLHIIGAMSGHGKTFWAMEWAKEAAKQGMNVLVLSLEMTHKDLSARTLSALSDFPLLKIIQRDFSDVQKIALRTVIDEESAAYTKKIHIETFGDYDWVKIYPRLIDRMMQLQPKLIIVDYIQMITNSEEHERMSQTLSDISRELKLFADENDSAALVLSQLNREAFKDIKKLKIEEGECIPLSLSYIKESGGIVEAADSVQMVCIPQKLEMCPYHLRETFQVTVEKSRRLGLHGTKIFPFHIEKMEFK